MRSFARQTAFISIALLASVDGVLADPPAKPPSPNTVGGCVVIPTPVDPKSCLIAKSIDINMPDLYDVTSARPSSPPFNEVISISGTENGHSTCNPKAWLLTNVTWRAHPMCILGHKP